jgi:PHD/YefM family antitoxin component YafN of YafNO toxin-antitoxin module
MIELHSQIVTKDGEKQFVILPYDEFATIQEALADADDLNALRIAKNEESNAPTVPLEEVISSLGL